MTLVKLQPQNLALLNHWRSLRSSSPIPPVSAFDPERVRDLWDAVFVLDATPPDFTVCAWGQELTELLGWDLTDQPYLMLTGREEYLDDRRVALFRAAIDQQAIGVYGSLFWENRTGLVAEEIYLPLASENGNPGRVLGSIRLAEPKKMGLTKEKQFLAWRLEVFAVLEPRHPGQSSPSLVKSFSKVSLSKKEILRSKTYKCLRQLLVKARENTGLSQDALGRRVGRGQSYISNIETGQRGIDVIEFIEITKALRLDPIQVVKQLVASFKSEFSK